MTKKLPETTENKKHIEEVRLKTLSGFLLGSFGMISYFGICQVITNFLDGQTLEAIKLFLAVMFSLWICYKSFQIVKGDW